MEASPNVILWSTWEQAKNLQEKSSEKNNLKISKLVRKLYKKFKFISTYSLTKARSLNHQSICRFYDMFEFDNEIYIILELCQNNSLKCILFDKS